jgi:hypothetical protein
MVAIPQLVWINPLEVFVDTHTERGLIVCALYRTAVCNEMVYDSFFMDMGRCVPPTGMIPFMWHPTQPTRPLSAARAYDIWRWSRQSHDEIEYHLLIRMLNRLEDLQFSRRYEWTIGIESVYRHVDNARGFVHFGHRTLRINDEPFRSVIDSWYLQRQTGANENRMFGAVAQIIIDTYTNLRLPDFEGHDRAPTLALQHNGVYEAYDWLLTQARERARTHRLYVNTILQRWDTAFPSTEVGWQARVAAEPVEEYYLDYVPVPPIDRPQAFTPAWRNGERTPIPAQMIERLQGVQNREQFQTLDRMRQQVNQWPLQSYHGVYGHDETDGCWFTTACQQCPRPATGVAMYSGRGSGHRQMDAHLRTVLESPEFRAAVEMGPNDDGGVAGRIETRGEEDFEDCMSD